MPLYLNTRGNSNLGIGICDRCRQKFPIDQLQEDRNTPGLRVCAADNDEFDPWRLPARTSEDITLPFYRPDVPLGITAEGEEQGPFRITEVDEDYRDTEDDDYRITQVYP
jgi:hypothetical protein